MSFYGEGVVLVPHITIMDMDAPPRHVEAVGVEGGEVDAGVAVGVRAAGGDLAVPDSGVPKALRYEVEAGRVKDVPMLEHKVRGALYAHKRRAVLAVEEVAHSRDAPPHGSVAVKCSCAR